MELLKSDGKITRDLLSGIHKQVFPDHGLRAGEWRTTNVQVASHIAPEWEWMDTLMEELEYAYHDLELGEENLKHWYFDFNTIHPLRDGNGRTGGIAVAAVSYIRYGMHLTPGQ